MTENETPDTITVELPIEAEGDGRVNVAGAVLSRVQWRDVAAINPGWSALVGAIAPAVVAWMDRDEFKPLDLPDEGRTIKATLRDGAVETFKVREVLDDDPWWAEVWRAAPDNGLRYIQRTPDGNDHEPTDIVVWEYVDEPAQPAISADVVEAVARWGFEQNRERWVGLDQKVNTWEEALCRDAWRADARAALAEAGLTVAGDSE